MLTERLIFGGSFDPPHHGHFEILNYLFNKNITNHVDLIPAAVSPFKTEKAPHASQAERWDMLQLFVKELQGQGLAPQRLHLHDWEFQREAPSWTVDTCRTLRAAYPNVSIGILLGADGLAKLDAWQGIAELWEHHSFFIFPRPGIKAKEIEKQRLALLKSSLHKARLEIMWNAPQFSCSSTTVRKLLQTINGNHARLKNYLLPAVLHYIQEKSLY